MAVEGDPAAGGVEEEEEEEVAVEGVFTGCLRCERFAGERASASVAGEPDNGEGGATPEKRGISKYDFFQGKEIKIIKDYQNALPFVVAREQQLVMLGAALVGAATAVDGSGQPRERF